MHVVRWCECQKVQPIVRAKVSLVQYPILFVANDRKWLNKWFFCSSVLAFFGTQAPPPVWALTGCQGLRLLPLPTTEARSSATTNSSILAYLAGSLGSTTKSNAWGEPFFNKCRPYAEPIALLQ